MWSVIERCSFSSDREKKITLRHKLLNKGVRDVENNYTFNTVNLLVDVGVIDCDSA